MKVSFIIHFFPVTVLCRRTTHLSFSTAVNRKMVIPRLLNTFEQKDYLDLNLSTKTHDLEVLVNTDTWLLDVCVYKSHMCLCIYRPTHELCILGEALNRESFNV